MRNSVYAPGPGARPPLLVGRGDALGDLLADVLDIGERGRRQDILLIGPRGVGKTVLMAEAAESLQRQGFEHLSVQAVGGQVWLVRTLMQRAAALIDAGNRPWKRAKKALDRIASVSFGIASVTATVEWRAAENAPTPPDPSLLADALAAVAREAAKEKPRTGLLLTIDELQAVHRDDLALLSAVLHRLTVEHASAPVALIATGLTSTWAVLREAGVTHPDRLFRQVIIPAALTIDEVWEAVVEPAYRHTPSVRWDPEAVELLARASGGYPAHVQIFADRVWRAAAGPERITAKESAEALQAAEAEVLDSAVAPRWASLSDRQKEYVAALAVNGGTAVSSVVAATCGRTSSEVSDVRDSLLRAGDIWAPRYGRTALTVPAWRDFVLEHYPDEQRDSTRVRLVSLEQMAVYREQRRSSGGSQSGV